MNAVVTGSEGAIGRKLVEGLQMKGYHVVGIDKIPKTSKADDYLLIDFSKPSINFGAINETIGQKLNLLVNNAAIQIVNDFEVLREADFEETFRVNVQVPFLMIQKLMRPLEAVKGSVVNIGSIHSKLTKPKFSLYSASKGALEAMTRALAVELGSRIRINNINPAAIDTDMLKSGFNYDSEKIKELTKLHPVNRVGLPDDVLNAVIFLASNKATFINGATLELTGGIGARLHDPS